MCGERFRVKPHAKRKLILVSVSNDTPQGTSPMVMIASLCPEYLGRTSDVAVVHDRIYICGCAPVRERHCAATVRRAAARTACDSCHPISSKLGRPFSCRGESGTGPPKAPLMTLRGHTLLGLRACHGSAVPNLHR